MKKIKIALFLSFALTSTVFAQQYGYNKGDKLLNLGVGVNSYYDSGLPLSISFEQGVTDKISVGGGVDYLSNKYKLGDGLFFKFTALYFGARASYHVNELLKVKNEKIDLYGGITAGYRSFTWKDNYNNSTLGNSYGSGVFFGGYIGGKYFFSDRLGGFTELGAAGSTNARVGLALKL